MVVSVFGSSWPVPGDPGYEEGLEVGRLLARAGYTVCTGGYAGMMEAVSRGGVGTLPSAGTKRLVRRRPG